MVKPQPIRLALDQNFPTPILRALSDFIVDIQLVPLREIDPRLSTLDDRPLVIALHQLGYPGLVTNNYKMLKNPQELAAIIATKITVFAIEGVAWSPSGRDIYYRADLLRCRDLLGVAGRSLHPALSLADLTTRPIERTHHG